LYKKVIDLGFLKQSSQIPKPKLQKSQTSQKLIVNQPYPTDELVSSKISTETIEKKYNKEHQTENTNLIN
jgi:hypothetical protein